MSSYRAAPALSEPLLLHYTRSDVLEEWASKWQKSFFGLRHLRQLGGRGGLCTLAMYCLPNPGLAVGDFIACGLVRCVTTLAVDSPQMDLDYLKYNPGVRQLPI